MTEPGLKLRLLDALEQAREREAILVAACDDQPPAVPGQWSARDNLAHLAAWRTHAAGVLRAVREGKPGPEIPGSFDEQNARIYAENKDRGAAEVLGLAAASYDLLIAEIEAASDVDLTRPRPEKPERLTWEIVPGDGHQHVAEHLSYWHLDHGDWESAEAAQLWSRSIDDSPTFGVRSRASALYNLGCFYARTGHGAQALSPVREAFQLDPALRSVAGTDPDLDSIRDLDEYTSMLDG